MFREEEKESSKSLRELVIEYREMEMERASEQQQRHDKHTFFERETGEKREGKRDVAAAAAAVAGSTTDLRL